MSIHQAGRVARAVSSVVWCFDTVFKFAGGAARKVTSKFTDNPLYDIDILYHGEITESKYALTESQVSDSIKAVKYFKNAAVVVRQRHEK